MAAIIKEQIDPKDSVISNLTKKDRRKIYEIVIPMVIEGNGWFKCILEPADKNNTITYFTQQGNQNIGTEVWAHMFNVINRERLEIIKLLKEIKDK